MVDSCATLAGAVEDLVHELSEDFVRRFVALLQSHESLSDVTPARIMREVANDAASDRLTQFVRHFQQIGTSFSPASIAFGIDCALATRHRCTMEQSVDIVWTGPGPSSLSMRRSAAVLLELIRSARSDIVIMSFAAFRIADALASFCEAAERGVTLYFVLESEEDSDGRYSQNGESPYGSLRSHPRVKFFRWPLEKRPRHALLHAKAVIVDRRQALVTSANLTENAISANIEIGVLIRGGDAPCVLHDHIVSLVNTGEFREIG